METKKLFKRNRGCENVDLHSFKQQLKCLFVSRCIMIISRSYQIIIWRSNFYLKYLLWIRIVFPFYPKTISIYFWNWLWSKHTNSNSHKNPCCRQIKIRSDTPIQLRCKKKITKKKDRINNQFSFKVCMDYQHRSMS